MRVLEKGRAQKSWAEKFKCTGVGNSGGGCGALLLVEQDDIYKTYARDETCNTFRCADCGVETDIPSNVYLNFFPPQKSLWEARRKARENLVDGPS